MAHSSSRPRIVGLILFAVLSITHPGDGISQDLRVRRMCRDRQTYDARPMTQRRSRGFTPPWRHFMRVLRGGYSERSLEDGIIKGREYSPEPDGIQEEHKNVYIPVPLMAVINRTRQLNERGVRVGTEDVDQIIDELIDEYNEGRNESRSQAKSSPELAKGALPLPTEEEMQALINKNKRENGFSDDDGDSCSGHEDSEPDAGDYGINAGGREERRPDPGTGINDEDGFPEPRGPRTGFLGNVPGLKEYKESLSRPKQLKIGQTVVIHGLKNSTEYNDQQGIIIGNITREGRYPVRLLAIRSSDILIEWKNLEALFDYNVRMKHEKLQSEFDRALNLSRESEPSEKAFAENYGWGGKAGFTKNTKSLTKYEKNTTLRNQRMSIDYTRWHETADPEVRRDEASFARRIARKAKKQNFTKSTPNRTDKTQLGRSSTHRYRDKNITGPNRPKSRDVEKVKQLLDRTEAHAMALKEEIHRACQAPGSMISLMRRKGANEHQIKQCMENEQKMRSWFTELFLREGGTPMQILQGDFSQLAAAGGGEASVESEVSRSDCD
mmetsp:Transcript_14251/g.22607  ORF Transcript_14251/g.22607 Transcript_14251/m.22607 type:complete len:554 (-) Transcript_14251:134-1795(-)